MADHEEAFLREVFERWNRGEFDLDDFLDRIDPEVVIDSSLTGAEWHGYDGIRGWLADIQDQFETWALELNAITEQRPGVWMAEGIIQARGRRSGVELGTPVAWVVRFRDGRAYHWAGFLSPSEAEEKASRPEGDG